MSKRKLKYEVLPSNKIFDEREYGLIHTSYEIETAFYSTIKRGNPEEMKAMMEKLLQSKLVLGKLSKNSIRQLQYWAVCCITIATRYAIDGGLDETAAFNFSDECIMAIDTMTNEDDILEFLIKKSEELTLKVQNSKVSSDYPKAVRKCLGIINTNLFTKLKLDALASQCGMSKDHLSLLFKKHVGMTIPQYIKNQRLNEAEDMLKNGKDISTVAYTIGFCSESYFIKCFREQFGITPKEYVNKERWKI